MLKKIRKMNLLFCNGGMQRNNFEYRTLFALKKSDFIESVDSVGVDLTKHYPELNQIFDGKVNIWNENWLTEREWEKDVLKKEKLDRLISDMESKLGLSLKRIYIGDRHLNKEITKRGFISFKTRLTRYCELDNENAIRVIKRFIYYYDELLKRKVINVVLFHGIGDVSSMSLALLCRFYDIPILSFYSGRILPRTMYFASDIMGFNHNSHNVYYQKMKNGIKAKDASLQDLKRFEVGLGEKYHKFRADPNTSRRFLSMKPYAVLNAFADNFVYIFLNWYRKKVKHPKADYTKPFVFTKSGRIAVSLLWMYFGFLLNYRMRIFQELNEEELKNINYVYFPLPQEPELSTYVHMPEYSDTINLIETVAKMLPLNMKLVLRDNFPNIGMRPWGYYKHLSKIPGVILISPTKNPLPITKNAKLIITGNGTTGWEALCMRKAVLTFGKCFYDPLGFTYKAKDIGYLDKQIMDIIKNHKVEDEEYFNKIGLFVDSEKETTIAEDEQDLSKIANLFKRSLKWSYEIKV